MSAAPMSAAPPAGAASPGPAPLLRVRNLVTRFETRAGALQAVDGVSFDVAAGEVVGLVGESGSGKTVTGFSLLGLIDPPGRIVSGSVTLEGRELVGLAPSAMRAIRGRRVAMVFQDPSATLNPVLRIGDQMALALAAHERLSPRAARARIVEALESVGIPDAASRVDAYPHQFSGGMRQRVCLAIALLNRPALVVADEPTTALDVSIQAQILALTAALVRDLGTALLWISHDLATVSTLAKRILVMYAGRIVESGTAADVLGAPRHPYTRGLLDSLPARAAPGQDLAQIPGAMPSLLRLPPGCAFAPRCPRAQADCRAAPPPAFAEAGPRGARSHRCLHPLGPNDGFAALAAGDPAVGQRAAGEAA